MDPKPYKVYSVEGRARLIGEFATEAEGLQFKAAARGNRNYGGIIILVKGEALNG